MKKIVIIFLSLVALIVGLYGLLYSKWFLTAFPIGFLFGFFLQKGDLCASSAMSEVIMFKDRSKIWGFWVAIVTTMLSISIIDFFGFIDVNPKAFYWMNYLVGGVLFGVGIVLAGGCISGVLYKSGTGNINSIMALMSIPFGIAAVEVGPFKEFNLWMKTFVINGSNGEPLTLYYLTGIPYLLLAIIFVVGTILYLLFRRKRFEFSMALNRSWKPWIAGIAIGILSLFAYLSSNASGRNYALGVTHGVYHNALLFFENKDNLNIVTEKPVQKVQAVNSNIKGDQQVISAKKKVSGWLILVVIGLVAGSLVSGLLSGQAKLLPKDPHQTVIALIGGFLVGSGAAFAEGCSIGNILSGWGMMSIGNFEFGIVVVLANWITTYFYLMGGNFQNK